ncbi:MAG: hypothetical protein M0Z92_00630 [Actinomycetota bacterium]|nr:hypothetical protein [Actinomycetota bacterium]
MALGMANAEREKARLREIAAEVIPASAATPLGLYAFRADDLGAELARSIEGEVFLETFGNTPEMLREEYLPYEGRTFYLCVVDHVRRLPVGAMRVIVPRHDCTGSKTLDDIRTHWGVPREELTIRSGEPFDCRSTWDIATLAVSREYQGRATAGLVAVGLYSSYVRTSILCQVDYVVAILDARMFRFGNWEFKGTWSVFDRVDGAPYLGSPSSFPVWCQLSDWGGRLAEADPILHGIVFRGRGMDPVLGMAPIDKIGELARRLQEKEELPEYIDLRSARPEPRPAYLEITRVSP